MKIDVKRLFDKFFVRLILAWLITALIFVKKSSSTFNSNDYSGTFNFVLYAGIVILIFIVLSVVGYFGKLRWFEIFGPVVLLTIYGFICVDNNRRLVQIVAFIFGIAIAASYAANESRKFLEIKSKYTVISVYAVFAILYVVIVSGITIYRYMAYYSAAYDLGIWSQMFHYMKDTFKPLTTCERDRLMSHFCVHFSPIYYLILPFYCIYPTVATLQVMQTVVLISGLVPLYLLCKQLKLSKSATLLFGVVYAIYPALACGCYYDLHENAFLTPLILWVFYFIERENLIGVLIFALLTALVKEDAPVYLASMGLFVLISKKDYKRGISLFIFSITYFLIVLAFMEKYGLGVMSWRYNNMMPTDSSGGGLGNVIITFLTNPAYAFAQCCKTDRYEFMVQMLLPVGLLPFATRKISRYILLIPFILVSLASDYNSQYSIYYQYTFGVTAIFFYMSILNYSELTEKPRHFMATIAVCAGIIMLPAFTLSKKFYYDTYNHNIDKMEEINEALDVVPDDVSVIASNYFLPHLADRDEVYLFPSSHKADYMVLDLRNSGISEFEIGHMKATEGYAEVCRIYNVLVVLAKVNK